MDEANRAMCWALRHPADGSKPMKYKDIRKVVRKTDGRLPGISAIQEAAATFKDVKGQRGRPKGSRKTTKEEDKKILQTFHRARPPGCGIDMRSLKDKLPKKLGEKIGWDTLRRCLRVEHKLLLLRRCDHF